MDKKELIGALEDNTFRDYLRVVFRHKILFLVIPIAILLPTYVSLQLKTPVYRASVKMYVKAAKETEADYYQGMFSGNLVQDHAELVNSNIVLERVVKALKLYEFPIDYEKKFASPLRVAILDYLDKKKGPGMDNLTAEEKKARRFSAAVNRLRSSISVEPIKATSFFLISVTDFNPSAAVTIANSVSRSYVIFDLEQQIQEFSLKYGEKHTSVIQLQNYIKNVEKTLHGRLIPYLEAIGPASIKIVDQAESASEVRAVNAPLLLLMAFGGSIFISVMFAFLLDTFDETVKSPQDVAKTLNLPVISSVPKRKITDKLIIGSNNSSVYSQSLRVLAERIKLLMDENNYTSLLFADAQGTYEAAAMIVNIAIILSRRQLKVLIIDADLKSSAIANILKIQDTVGLADVIEGRATFMSAMQSHGSDIHVLTSGGSDGNSKKMLNISKTTEILKEVGDHYDVILINIGDIHNTDTCLLSSCTDGFVLVISEGKVRKQVLKKAFSPFEQKDINIIGAILNKRKYVIPKIIYKLT